MKEIIKLINSENEIMEHINNIEEGDYVEIYIGRCHVEGMVVDRDDTFFRLESDNELIGRVEFELNDKIIGDIVEIVYISEKRGIKTIVRYP